MDKPAATEGGDDLWRPRLHFCAASGFINDPNGLIYIAGQYHAFFQHNPDDVVHGPMHWGHAVSDDLVHWQELPIALYPDALGQCFSGSAVPTPDGNVALMYTAHLERSGDDPLQTQCLVYADHSLTHFKSEPRNPVLGNQNSLKDYRDPKVFWHALTSAWIMLITQGRHVGIYRSNDLLDWAFSSEFGHELGAPGDGAWECPDLVNVPLADGGERWVLIVGIWSGAPGGGSGTQYFLGEFDGYRFEHDVDAADIHWFDHGRDYYAAQSFAGRERLAPRVIAWCSNWQYANDTPTRDFRGAFTLPRDLELIDTPEGYLLRQSVPDFVRRAFPLMEDDGKPAGGAYRLSRKVSLEPGECVQICLFGESTPPFTIERPVNGRQWRLRIYRDSVLSDGAVLTPFGCATVVELAQPEDGTMEFELFVDHGLVELFLSGGVDVTTMCFYPADPSGYVSVLRKS